MIRKLLALYFLTLSINFCFSQNTVGTISITEDAFEALTLFNINTKAYLINNCGELVNEWTSNYLPGSSVYLLPNGNLLRAGRLEDGSSDIAFGGQGGIVELFDWDGNIVWSYIYSSSTFRQHHDIYPLPNGNILLLAATVMTEAEAIQAGRDPSFLIDNELYNEQILELEPVGTNQANIVWEWNINDHLIQDFDATKDNFGVVEDNPQRLDINFLNGGTGGNNWLHVNSIQYNEERDQIVISARRISEIWIIDHSTSTAESASTTGGTYNKGGDLLYRWGNPEAYRQGSPSDRTLFGQHTPRFIKSGLPNENKIILFNNGFQRSPEFSQVDIITPPESSLGVYDYTPNSSYGPLNTDYTYSDLSEDPSAFFTAIVSSAQQLPNGNILICEGRDGYFFELDSNNEKVWEYINPINNNNGNSTQQGMPAPGTNLTFRATKYPLNFSGFDGRDLSPNLPLELNPDLTPCNNLSIVDFNESVVGVYPNPTNTIINISSTQNIDKIEVYNTLGQKVVESRFSTIDLSLQNRGIYFLKIHSVGKIISRKVIKN
ncbi:aryl-sulfate sulfotransferase [Winogradskyella sp. UBA3174]|uniref:aryl-sulfate sulfotransferase n=1 Tax=Winogradskyella sp. UBA3174 TaxID=1947785 RepID=UPI0025FAB84D|nr:aryl-sulfate sulfotransferase [Winogradskyella sp. UBA3174]|tara:strand:+ start:2803 stop:4446 length:1644 start_codon:yes stop_codon:yes gene_type:complete